MSTVSPAARSALCPAVAGALLGEAVGLTDRVVGIEVDGLPGTGHQARHPAGEPSQEARGDRVELPDVIEGTGPQVHTRRGRGPARGEDPAHASVTQRLMSAMPSAPATMPATNAGTFTAAFAPAGRGMVRRSATSSCYPAGEVRPITGTRPAVDTRFGSSKAAEKLLRDSDYRVLLMLSGSGP